MNFDQIEARFSSLACTNFLLVWIVILLAGILATLERN